MAPQTDSELLMEAKTLVMQILGRRSNMPEEHHGADLFQHTRAWDATFSPAFTVTFAVTVAPGYANPSGNLHGGAAAMIADILSSVSLTLWAMVAAPEDSDLARNWTASGVSRTLNCSYVRPAPLGSEVLVENTVVSVGKSLALLRGELRSKDTGKVLATFEHHKVMVPPGSKPRL